MNLLSLILLSISLSLDTFAASISCGIASKELKFSKTFRVVFTMALFQGGMLVIGWILGSQIKNIFKGYGYLLAFALLFALGVKMIIDSIKAKEKFKCFNPYVFGMLIGISFATSIDALSVGISYALIDLNIMLIFIVLFIVTFIFASAGFLFGNKTGNIFGEKIEILGGIILIFLGTKILIEHSSIFS